MTIRLSVTMLDTFVSGMADPDMTEYALAERLFGKFEPSAAMRAGTAFHYCLEHSQDADDLQLLLTSGNDRFVFVLPDSIDGTVELGKTRERKRVWRILPDVDLVGKIDAETDFHVIDHKLTGRFDAERYMDSWQWRAYLAMTGKPMFAYQIFEHGGIGEPDDQGNTVIEIKRYHRLEQSRYQGVVNDVRGVTAQLAEFASEWMERIKSGASPEILGG